MASADAVRDANRDAWNADRYDAWVAAIGAPEAEAARVVADPRKPPRRLLPHLGDVAGRRICSVQGLHGRIAVALALLGADVTVIDFSEANRRYALQLAAAAGVCIGYHVGDVMEAESLGLRFDAVIMELGILHYHQDLQRFFDVMAAVAAPGARLVLNEFHPIQRKLFWDSGPHDYFHTGLVVADVPNPVISGPSLGQCAYRLWTLGEVVTAVIAAGFVLVSIEEHADTGLGHIPGSFTLVADRAA